MMLDKILKAFPLGTSILCLTSGYSASTDMQSQVNAIKEVNVHETTGALNPTARPAVNGTGFFATGDYLLWRADEDGLDYAFEATTPVGDVPLKNGKILEVHPKWSQGWRFGLGYRFPYDTWDLTSNWTHLFSRARSDAFVHPGGLLQSTLQLPDQQSLPFLYTTLDADADFKLMYNTFDLDLGRSFFISRDLSIRPYVGLRGAWINQHLDVLYGVKDMVITNERNTLAYHGRNFYRGVGVRSGVDINYYLNKCWSIYGKASAAVLLGTFSITQRVTFPRYPDMDLIHEHLHRTRTTVQAAAGIQWEHNLIKDRFHLTLSLGYEFNQWFHMNQFRTFLDNQFLYFLGQTIPHKGNLGLQGGTFSARVDF